MDIPLSMAVDSQENVYLTGTTTSTNFPITVNAVQTTGAGSVVAAFVLELNPFGVSGAVSLVYSTFLGGTTGRQFRQRHCRGSEGADLRHRQPPRPPTSRSPTSAYRA